jgi:hypothetical protein
MSFRSLRLGRVRPGVSMLAACAVGVLVVSACGSTTLASVVRTNAISVDGTGITRRSFQHDVDALAANKKFVALDKQVASQGSTAQSLFDAQGKPTRVLTTSWLNRLANQIVIDREFKRRHLVATTADRTEGAAQFAQLFATQSDNGTALVAQFPKWFLAQEKEREARIVAVTRALDSRVPVTAAAMRAFYTKNVGGLCPSGFDLAHILVKTLPEAQAIESQLAAGADFATLARTKSIDKTSGAQGGSLGCFKTGTYVAVFEQAALKATIGAPTAPVHSEFGYHIILKSKFVPPTFASVEAEIRVQLMKQRNLLAKFVSGALKTAKVRVDPVYGTWNKTERKVKAPTVPAVRNSRNAPTTPTS